MPYRKNSLIRWQGMEFLWLIFSKTFHPLTFSQLNHLLFSQIIFSIGHPATGHLIWSVFPATAEIGDIARTNGIPYIFNRAVCDDSPALDFAIHAYSPPSSGFTFVILTWETTSDDKVTYWPIINRSLFGRAKPSRVHEIWGVGLPDLFKQQKVRDLWKENLRYTYAVHFRETPGPGCSVCSMNR